MRRQHALTAVGMTLARLFSARSMQLRSTTSVQIPGRDSRRRNETPCGARSSSPNTGGRLRRDWGSPVRANLRVTILEMGTTVPARAPELTQWRQNAPFAVVAAVGLLSAAWPPGPVDPIDFWLSATLLVGTVVIVALPRKRMPGAWAVPACLYVGSVGFLLAADGGSASGLGSLLLIPILAVALYGKRWESAIVVVAVVVVLLAVTMVGPHVLRDTVRRLMLFGSMGVVISLTIHGLRDRLAVAHRRLEQQATAEERRRIARELHDGLAHELAFIASKTHSSGHDHTVVDIDALADAADRALDEARRAISVLSSPQPEPLARGLAQTAEDLGSRLGMAILLDLDRDVDLPGQVNENLIRIEREAITNAARHGHPTQVLVRLRRDAGVRLVVEDDGCGFDIATISRDSGFGLVSMEERARSVGARFNLDSSPGHGTRVEVALP